MRRPLLILAGFVGAFVLLLFVLRISMADAFLDTAPGMAAVLSPHHPEVQLEQASQGLALSYAPEAAQEAAAQRALARDPLSEVPFLLAARRAISEGDGTRADRLVAVAARRNPRSRFALLLQLERDAGEGRLDAVAARMAVLSRLSSDANALLVPQLARMAAFPETRGAVAQVLAGDPRLKASVLAQLARTGTDPQIVLALAGNEARRPAGAEVPEWLRLLLDSMIGQGQAAEARELWLRQSGAAAEAREQLVYDPDFTGLPGPPPFNWKFETSADGFAERNRGAPGLQVEYYGRRDARLASQLLLLAPGAYTLSFEAEGQGDEEDTRVAWKIVCEGADAILAEVPITGVDFTPKRFSGAFTVPAGCRAQWLHLIGKAAEFPKDQRLVLRGLRIMRGGA